MLQSNFDLYRGPDRVLCLFFFSSSSPIYPITDRSVSRALNPISKHEHRASSSLNVCSCCEVDEACVALASGAVARSSILVGISPSARTSHTCIQPTRVLKFKSD